MDGHNMSEQTAATETPVSQDTTRTRLALALTKIWTNQWQVPRFPSAVAEAYDAIIRELERRGL